MHEIWHQQEIAPFSNKFSTNKNEAPIKALVL